MVYASEQNSSTYLDTYIFLKYIKEYFTIEYKNIPKLDVGIDRYKCEALSSFVCHTNMELLQNVL